MAKPMLKKMLWGFWAACLILVVIMTVGVVWMSQEVGRLWIFQQVQTLAAAKAYDIQVTGARSPGLSRWSFKHITIKKNQQPLIEVDNLKLHWRWRSLLQGELRIRELTADKMNVYKLPAPSTSAPPSLAFMDAIPRNLWVQHLAIKELNLLGFAKNQMSLRYGVQANMDTRLSHNQFNVSANLMDLDTQIPCLVIRSHVLPDQDIQVEGYIKESPQRLLTHLLRWPEAEGIQADFNLNLTLTPTQIAAQIIALNVDLLGQKIKAQGNFLYHADQPAIDLTSLEVWTGEHKQHLMGKWSPGQLNLNGQFDQFSLALINPWVPRIQGGEATGQVALNWLYRTPQTWPQVSADINGQLRYRDKLYTTQLKGQLSDKQLLLQPSWASVEGAEIRTEGLLDFTGDNTQLKGTLSSFNLMQLMDWGVSLPGDFKGLVNSPQWQLTKKSGLWNLESITQWQVDYRQQPMQWQFESHVNAKTLTLKKAQMNYLNTQLTGSGKVNWATKGLNVKVELSQLTQQAQALLPDAWRMDGLNNVTFNANAKAHIKGTWLKPDIHSDWSVDGRFKKDEQEWPFVWQGKGQYVWGTLSEMQLNLESTHLSLHDQLILALKGQYSAKQFDLQARLVQLPAQMLSAFNWGTATGTAEGELNFKGSLAEPRVDGHLKYRDFIDGVGSAQLPVDVITDIKTLNQRIHLMAKVFHQETETGHLSVVLPAEIPGRQQVKNRPLNVQAEGQFDLKYLQLIANLRGHALSGRLNTNLDILGTYDNPQFEGQLTLVDGRYRNPSVGLPLDNIQAVLKGNGERLVIERADANSGDGRVALEGYLEWRARGLNTQAVDMRLTANKMALMRRRDIHADATGQLQLTGRLDQLNLNGNLAVSPLDIRVQSNSTTPIPELKNIQEVGQRPQTTDEASVITLPKVNLNVTLNTGKKAFLRGRGLDTELEGSIQLLGTLSEPIYRGEFNTRRGRMDLFGKKFVLTDGDVTFTQVGVLMQIEALHTDKEYEFRATLTGTGEQPKLTFTATPDLPQDEILARLIFGKSAQDMSTLEAIQLANAVNSLTRGDGLDPLGKTRDLLGLDSLTLQGNSDTTTQQQKDANSYTLGVGKYLNERVYVELQGTSNSLQPWQGSIEIELSPKVLLESKTNKEGGADVQFLWKKDY